MPEVQIVIKTKAELAELQRTAEVTKKTTEEVVKLGNESAKTSDQVKKVSVAAKKVSDDSQQMAGHLSKLTKETKEAGVQAEKTAGFKGKWLDALKKLQGEIPGLSYVVGALKNPFVALIAVIAVSINWLAEFNAKIQRLREIVGDGKIGEQFVRIGEILGNAEVRARAFAKALDDIRGRGESVPEQVARMQANADRALALQEAAATTPEEKARIAQKRLAAKTNIAAQGFFRARDIVREGEAAFPAMNQELAAAEARRNQMLGLADANTTSPEAIKEIEAQIAEIEAPGFFNSIKRQVRFGTRGDMMSTLGSLKDTLANARAGNQVAGRLRATATGDFEATQQRFNAFTGRIAGAQEQMRTFGAQREAAQADVTAFRPINTPNADAEQRLAAMVQARFEALAKMILEGQDKALALVARSIQRERTNANRP